MLAKMPGKVLEPHAKLEIFMNVRMPDVEAGMMEGMFERVVVTLPFPLRDKAGEPVQCLNIKAHRLADLARCGFSTIGDDVGRHRRAQFPIALVNVLNGQLTFVSR